MVEAWSLLQQHSTKLNVEELLRHMYELCQEMGLMQDLLKLPFTDSEQVSVDKKKVLITSWGIFLYLLDNNTVTKSCTSLLLETDGFIICMYLRARLCSPWHMSDWIILICCHDTVLIVAGWNRRANEFCKS